MSKAKDFFNELPKRHGRFIDLDKLVNLEGEDYEEVWLNIVGQDQKGIEVLRGCWSSEFMAFCLALSFYQSEIKKALSANEGLAIELDFADQTNREKDHLIFNLKNENEKLQDKLKKIIEYCQPHTEFMWSASILAIVLDCDFRDINSALEKEK
jgi:hypothetical protein